MDPDSELRAVTGKRERRRGGRVAGRQSGGDQTATPVGAIPLCRFHHWVAYDVTHLVCIKCSMVTPRTMDRH